MPLAALFPHLAGLTVRRVRQTIDLVTLDVAAEAATARCPACAQPSGHLHSRYTRRVADQPVAGRAVRIRFHVRRFRCRNLACSRATFVEQCPALVARSGRSSAPLQRQIADIGLTVGGRPGQRFAARRAIRVSRTTLLRLVGSRAQRGYRLPEPAIASPRVLGIDDFALKRGHRYGTIVIDLEAHRVLDLLPDRAADPVAAWLREHGHPEVICRDRGGDDAGARQGAPDAVQVADRFHLRQGSSRALERVLARHAVALRASVEEETGASGSADLPETTTGAGALATWAPPAAARVDPRRARRLARYEEVVALRQTGRSITAIGEAVGLSRPTVRKYLRAGSFPEWPARRTALGSGSGHATYLQQRWAEGCQDARRLWEELRARGFSGSPRMVQRAVSRWREGPAPRGRAAHRPRATTARPALRPPSPRQATWLLLAPPTALSVEQRAMGAQLLAAAPEVATALEAVEEFRRLVRARDRAALDPWFGQAEASGTPELRAFAANLRRDQAALEAALTYAWSSGQVEGQVTKIKLVKRQMFGRAKLDLLRKRMLLAA